MALEANSVHTSTTTSLWVMKRGMVEAWTGVMRLKPMLSTASMIHSARDGVKPSHARDEEEGAFIFWSERAHKKKASQMSFSNATLNHKQLS